MIARSFVFVIVLPHPRVEAWWKSLSPRPVILTLALRIIILTNYHSRSSVVREDESNRTLAKREEIGENKDAMALETQTQFFLWKLPNDSPSLLFVTQPGQNARKFYLNNP